MSKTRAWFEAEWARMDPLAKSVITGSALLICGLILLAFALGE